MQARSRITYSWNQIGPFTAARTSSMLQIDTVDSQNAMPAFSAARAAWTSARRANMLGRLLGSVATGSLIGLLALLILGSIGVAMCFVKTR